MAFSRAIDKSKENTVRRVIKQGHSYMCGMCNARYASEAQAEGCLQACIKRYMERSSVQDRPDKSGRLYRCSYCKRIYEKMIQAKDCARSCKDNIQKKIEAEARYKKTQTVEDKLKTLAAFAGGEHNLPPVRSPAPRPEAAQPPQVPANKPEPAARVSRPPPVASPSPSAAEDFADETLVESSPQPVHPAEGSKFERDGNTYRCHVCHQKYKKYQEAIACFDRHRDQERAGVAVKKDSDDKFYRDGAKYVCKKCNSKWFSRNEVISCFEGHPPEEDVLVTGAPEEASPSAAVPAATSNETLEASRARRVTARSDADKFFRDGAKYVCRICNKKLFTKSEVIQCYDAHESEGAPADSGPILTSEDIETAAVEKALQSVKVGNNREGEDKFFRDGPKYVCKKCNTKYFTRNEVIQCFDKH
jgi:hypothetical protein